MDYQVSARKYRPGTFDDVIGQSHVVQTLMNAIATKRIAHAFLFSGTRAGENDGRPHFGEGAHQ